MPTNPKSRKPLTRADRIAITLGIIAFLNFAAYGITATILGGDAINGKHENGRYYFYNKKPPTSKSAPQSSTTAASTPTPSGAPTPRPESPSSPSSSPAAANQPRRYDSSALPPTASPGGGELAQTMADIYGRYTGGPEW